MGLNGSSSFLTAIICSVLVFSGMQIYKPWLISSQFHTILGGYLGSLLFMLTLTALGNLETCVFGKSFQIKLFPEVFICLFFALMTAATIHRVCATSCLLLSVCSLYYLNKYSQKVYAQPVAPVQQVGKKKK